MNLSGKVWGICDTTSGTKRERMFPIGTSAEPIAFRSEPLDYVGFLVGFEAEFEGQTVVSPVDPPQPFISGCALQTEITFSEA